MRERNKIAKAMSSKDLLDLAKSNNGIISINRGDYAEIPLFIN